MREYDEEIIMLLDRAYTLNLLVEKTFFIGGETALGAEVDFIARDLFNTIKKNYDVILSRFNTIFNCNLKIYIPDVDEDDEDNDELIAQKIIQYLSENNFLGFLLYVSTGLLPNKNDHQNPRVYTWIYGDTIKEGLINAINWATTIHGEQGENHACGDKDSFRNV